MKTFLQVLSEDERAQVHERTLGVLARTGLRVDTADGRRILQRAGAEVDENKHIVRFPRELVEEALRLTPKNFVLGARRPGWDLQMNSGECTMTIDGQGLFVLDRETGERRPSRFQDWLEATRLIDALDELGVYWNAITASDRGDTLADRVSYWRHLFGNFSKHIQGGTSSRDYGPWFLEVLQVVFGDKEEIRRRHPVSCLLCPQSPLTIEGELTDAYLALAGWDIPVGVMPMPLMGATAPASMISNTVLGNAEVLGMLCLIQAAAPGTPFIYSPALAVMNPRTGRFAGGSIEGSILNVAAIEMARYYNVPVMGCGFATDQHVPCIQTGYERALSALPSVLAWPDILVGVGLLGGSIVLSFEQVLIDTEVYRLCRQAHRGIDTEEDKWLEGVIDRIGPGGNFLAEPSTARAVREGEWYINQLGMHDTFEKWDQAGRPSVVEEARQKVEQILETHRPLPLDEEVERELERIERKARAVE